MEKDERCCVFCGEKKIMVVGGGGGGGNYLTVFQLEQYVFCTTITYVRSLAFKVGELNQFSYAPNQDRYRSKAMMLWVQKTTLST